MAGDADRDDGQAVDAAVRSYARRMVDLDAEFERLRERDAWRTYAAAALQGMLAARLVAPDPLYGGSALRQAAELADGMLAFERARFAEGGGGGDASR